MVLLLDVEVHITELRVIYQSSWTSTEYKLPYSAGQSEIIRAILIVQGH